MTIALTLSREATRSLLELQNKGANHTRSFCVALAYSVSNTMPVPQVEIEDFEGYYRLDGRAIFVRQLLSKINELIPFDFRETEDYIKSFLKLRLSVVTMPEVPLAVNPEYSLLDFFQIRTFFSNDFLDTIKNDGAKLTLLVANLNEIVKDLVKSGENAGL